MALLVGGRVFAAMKRSLGAGEWIRRGLGVAVLAGVVAIALGLDTGLLTRVSIGSHGGTRADAAGPGRQPAIDQPSVVMQAQSGHDDERVQCHGRGPGMMMSNKSASQRSGACRSKGRCRR